jgi:hypothetical protein
MKFAKDRRSGTDVPAEKAVASAYYVCPVCGEEVFVRAGPIRVAHFAHRSGRASPECENYHPGFAIRNPLSPRYLGSPAGDRGLHIAPLALALGVEPAAGRSRKDLRRWRLLLTLPKAPSPTGRLRIATGFGPREVSLSRLFQGSQDIEVSPNAPHFGPEWVSDEVDFDYRQVACSRIDGFSPQRAVAFAAGVAKLKPRASNLEWGESYYVIWKRLDFKVPEAVIAQPMLPYEGWFAAFITLPSAPSDELTRWIEGAFGLRPHQAKQKWGILYPPAIDIDIDGHILVSSTRTLLLAFTPKADAEEAAILSITSGTAEGAVSLGANTSTLVRVICEGAANSLTLQWGSKQLPPIVSVDTSDTVFPLPAVALHIRESKLDADQQFFLHHLAGRHALNSVRSGRAELTSISIPRGVHGRLERRQAGAGWQQVLMLKEGQGSPRGGAWLVSTQRLRAITDAVRDLQADIRLAFGMFGHYVAFARRVTSVTGPALSSDTKRRIAWYCRANGIALHTAGRALEQCSDTELLRLMRGKPPRPHLIGYRNLLERRLQIERSERAEP